MRVDRKNKFLFLIVIISFLFHIFAIPATGSISGGGSCDSNSECPDTECKTISEKCENGYIQVTEECWVSYCRDSTCQVDSYTTERTTSTTCGGEQEEEESEDEEEEEPSEEEEKEGCPDYCYLGRDCYYDKMCDLYATSGGCEGCEPKKIVRK